MELNTDTLFDSMRSVIWMTDATVWLGDAEYTVAGSVRDAGELRGNIRAGGQGGCARCRAATPSGAVKA